MSEGSSLFLLIRATAWRREAVKSMTKCAKDCQTLAHRLGLGVKKTKNQKKKNRRQDESGADKDGDHLISAKRNYVIFKQ